MGIVVLREPGDKESVTSLTQAAQEVIFHNLSQPLITTELY